MESLDQFHLFLVREGKYDTSIKTYKEVLSNLFKKATTAEEIDKHLLNQYLDGKSTNYLNIIITAVRLWGKFKNDNSYDKIKFFKIKKTTKSTFSDEEIHKFLAVPKAKKSNPQRYAMFTLFFKCLAYSGMRAGEMASITPSHVDWGRNVFILEHTKTTPRLVPIAPMIKDELTTYIQKIPSDSRIFPITRDDWNNHLKVRIKRAGINRPHLSTHSFRHSFITRLLSEDINIFKVQRIVGHRNIETTNHYTHLVTKDLTIALTKDPLGRRSLSYEERFKQFREQVRKLLEGLALTIDEEKQMLAGLSE